jgi:surface antigen
VFVRVTPDCRNIGRVHGPVAPEARARRAAAAFLVLFAASLGGCSSVVPLTSFMASRDDVTGSIKTANPIASEMDIEDWRRAKGALGLALDPQGNGAPVNWDNPKSGAKGAFTPVGPAKAVDDRICRSFQASVGGSLPERALKGSACRSKDGEWMIGQIAPLTSPRRTS